MQKFDNVCLVETNDQEDADLFGSLVGTLYIDKEIVTFCTDKHRLVYYPLSVIVNDVYIVVNEAVAKYVFQIAAVELQEGGVDCGN